LFTPHLKEITRNSHTNHVKYRLSLLFKRRFYNFLALFNLNPKNSSKYCTVNIQITNNSRLGIENLNFRMKIRFLPHLRKQLAAGDMIENTFLGKISKSLEDSQYFETWSNLMKYYEFTKTHVNASLIWDTQGNMKQFNSTQYIEVKSKKHYLEIK
jgi:hypothetical protein